MKALLLLHWRVTRNHLKRRLHYLSVYFDWAGTVTYIYLLAFVLIVLGYYLYDPFTRIPFPVLISIERLAQGILWAVPLLWLLAALVFSGRTAILLSPADVHHLPLPGLPAAAGGRGGRAERRSQSVHTRLLGIQSEGERPGRVAKRRLLTSPCPFPVARSGTPWHRATARPRPGRGTPRRSPVGQGTLSEETRVQGRQGRQPPFRSAREAGA